MTTLTTHYPPLAAPKNGSLQASLKRLLMLFLAAVITLALFWVMASLVSQPLKPPGEVTEYVAINPVFREADTVVNERKSIPEPPKVLQPPQKIPDNIEPDGANDDLSNFGDGIALAGPDVTIETQTDLSVTGGEARPIVRISPQYPIAAARDGIEGWVRLSFSINTTGGVEDIQVLEAEPKRLFDREAIRALRKWKYRPKVVDGNPIKQSNLTVQLDFRLEQ